MMITVKELSRKRNITPQAVQKKAKQLGIPLRNGRYLFTSDQLEQMYGERFSGLNSLTNQPESNYYQPESNRYQKPINKNQHTNQHNLGFSEMLQSCRNKFFEINEIIMNQRFQNEELEEARKILLQSMEDITGSFENMDTTYSTYDQVEHVEINADDIVVR